MHCLLSLQNAVPSLVHGQTLFVKKTTFIVWKIWENLVKVNMLQMRIRLCMPEGIILLPAPISNLLLYCYTSVFYTIYSDSSSSISRLGIYSETVQYLLHIPGELSSIH
jgi:hypothetical protein